MRALLRAGGSLSLLPLFPRKLVHEVQDDGGAGGVMRSPGSLRVAVGMPRAMMAAVAGAGMGQLAVSAHHRAFTRLRRRCHNALRVCLLDGKTQQQRVADARAVSHLVEVRFANRATVRRGFGLSQDGVHRSQVGLRAVVYGQRIDGGQHFADIVVVPLGHACGGRRLLKLLARTFRQLQQRVTQKLSARGVLRQIPTQRVHDAAPFFARDSARRFNHMSLITCPETVVDVYDGTPEAHEFSMARSAASPLKLAP